MIALVHARRYVYAALVLDQYYLILKTRRDRKIAWIRREYGFEYMLGI